MSLVYQKCSRLRVMDSLATVMWPPPRIINQSFKVQNLIEYPLNKRVKILLIHFPSRSENPFSLILSILK
uniref:Uncharacterized protein n=1 Tax=Solanum lycopersicum TaxID=4081 RepID=A0A3Q7GLV1_SOLLC